MVKSKLKYFMILLFSSTALFAESGTFIHIEVNPNSVYLKQPAILKISVYTPTWFTKPPNVDKIVIPDAITLRKGRAQSIYEYIDNKRYTILYFEFYVFPLKTGELEIPEFKLSYSTPPEGDFKGVEINKKTKKTVLTVNKAVENLDKKKWFPAEKFSVTEKWSKDLEKLKVGDVVDRVITFEAEGTIAVLIPESKDIKINFGKAYDKTPRLNTLNENDILKAVRIEESSILIEKYGEFTLPKCEFYWWQLSTNRNYKRTIESKKIIIEDNPDLAILKTVQDSLVSIQNAEMEKEKTNYTLYAINLVIVVIILYIIYKFTLYLISKIRTHNTLQKKKYFSSEKYLFDQVKTHSFSNHEIEFYNAFLKWMRSVILKKSESIRIILTEYGEMELLEVFILFENQLFGIKKEQVNLKIIYYRIEKFRTKLLKKVAIKEYNFKLN